MKKMHVSAVIWRTLSILIVLVLLSVYLTSYLAARFTTSDDSDDGARVAVFAFEDDLSSQAQTLPTTFSPGESLTTSISIKNKGEVTLRYVVEVENLTKNLPISDRLVNSGEVACSGTASFSWSIEWPEDDNSVDYMGKMDILRLVVTVEQVN